MYREDLRRHPDNGWALYGLAQALAAQKKNGEAAAVRKRFNEMALEHARALVNDFRAEGVDTLELKTDSPYMPALQRFFKTRERRRV